MSADQIWIGDLPVETDDSFLRTIFGAYGDIVWCKTLSPKTPGQKAGALVQFSDPTIASFCVENLNGNMAEGLSEPIQVKFSGSKGTSIEKGGGKDKGKGKGKGKAVGQSFGSGKSFGKANVTSKNRSSVPPYSPTRKGGKVILKGGKGMEDNAPSDIDFGGKVGIAGLIKGAINGGHLMASHRPDENCIFVRGLPKDTTDRDLYELFSPFGAIPPGGVMAQQKDGACVGIGFVDFFEHESIQNAISSLNGLPTPDGDVLFLKQKNAKSNKGKGHQK